MEQKNKKSGRIAKLLRYVIPLIISVGLCYVLFTGIDFDRMMEVIRYQCDFRWITLVLFIAVLSHFFRAFRWGLQLRALGIDAPGYALVYSIFGTYAVNLVFPRLGEVWRTGYIAQRQDAPFSTVFGSMVADRLADTLSVLFLAFVAFVLARPTIVGFLRDNGESYMALANMLESPFIWGSFLLLAAVVWFLLAHKTTNRTLLAFQKFMKELWQGFAVIFRMPGKGQWLLLTVGIWGCYFLQMYVAFHAFPFTADVLAHYGALPALVTFVLASISMGVPSNGGIGPWQWAVMFALGIYGVDHTEAGAFANLVLGMNTLLIIGLGIFTFIAIMLDRKKLAKKSNSNT
ncbi:MAG: flippase-like domain-containing protein [Bacteroidales bacterium]|nr:flippase-like domain-containing protein [Bacteroidales bacterium]MDE6436884.1 flippase-like domain-containing protein [Muribaculaceae bacterium]